VNDLFPTIYFQAYSIFGFTVDFRAPSIPRFSAEWVGTLLIFGLHNSHKCSDIIAVVEFVAIIAFKQEVA
jgi:hypothetical protein